MILTSDLLNSYNRSRSNTDKTLPCHAPFLNINFEQNGNARACCYNSTHILGKWPEQSIQEIWEGTKANELRDYIRKNNFGGGCITCGQIIEAGNYEGVKAKGYDEFSGRHFLSRHNPFKKKFSAETHFPKVLEFELSNECNLECVMCNGYFSSSIRKNREKLPALHSPYNEKFVDELEEFIPHLTDAKFLGGEPFMIDIYLLIWERILKINPNVRLHITTNGTFLNTRIKKLLEQLNAGIILSMDSVEKETYEKIRVNSSYERVMENLEYFIAYANRKKTFVSMAVCPIIYNWKELPGILNFCISKNISLFLNPVFYPLELSLREQPIELLKEIIAFLESFSFQQKGSNHLSPHNVSIRVYEDFIKLLRGWLRERERLLEKKDLRLKQISASFNEIVRDNAEMKWSLQKITKTIYALVDIEGKGFFDEEKKMKDILAQLLIHTPSGQLSQALACYTSVSNSLSGNSSNDFTSEKIDVVAELIETHTRRNEILQQTAFAPPLFFASLLHQKNLEELKNDLAAFFNS